MSHAVQGHPRQMGNTGDFSKTWSTEEGNGKPLHHSRLENTMNSMKKQKGMKLEDESTPAPDP